MHGSFAAVTLAVTLALAAVGTMWQVELPPDPAPAVASAPRRPADPHALRLAERAQRGLARLAGRTTPGQVTRTRPPYDSTPGPRPGSDS